MKEYNISTMPLAHNVVLITCSVCGAQIGITHNEDETMEILSDNKYCKSCGNEIVVEGV